ncbi:MAG: hypothetical protein M1831_000396 [Alyxoria varia]|nr:MAG: hypothetical protein M1831_000396 [Alyxoria varia]
MDVTTWLKGLGEDTNGTDYGPPRSSLHDKRHSPQVTYLPECRVVDDPYSHDPSIAEDTSRRIPSLLRDVASKDNISSPSSNEWEKTPGGSSTVLSETPGVPAPSLHRYGQFERKPRRKTRPDLYEPSSRVRRRRRSAQGSLENTNVSKRPKRSQNAPRTSKTKHGKKHRGIERPGEKINRTFHAENVTQQRLTLNPSRETGIFRNGRASSPTKRRGLPDLTFSEMKFLQRPRSEKENSWSRTLADEPPKRDSQDSKGAIATSAFFTNDQHGPGKIHQNHSPSPRQERDLRKGAHEEANGIPRDQRRCYTGRDETGEDRSQNKLYSTSQGVSQDCPTKRARSATAVTWSSSARTCKSSTPSGNHKTEVENNGVKRIETAKGASYDSTSGVHAEGTLLSDKIDGANDNYSSVQAGKHLQGNRLVDEQEDCSNVEPHIKTPNSERSNIHDAAIDDKRCHITLSQLLESCGSALNRAGRDHNPRAVDPVWYGQKDNIYKSYNLQEPSTRLGSTACAKAKPGHGRDQHDPRTVHMSSQDVEKPKSAGNKAENHQNDNTSCLSNNEGLRQSDSEPLRRASHFMQDIWCRGNPTSPFRSHKDVDAQPGGSFSAPRLSYLNDHHDDDGSSYSRNHLADLQWQPGHAQVVHRTRPSHGHYPCLPEFRYDPWFSASMNESPHLRDVPCQRQGPFTYDDYDLSPEATDDRKDGSEDEECVAGLVRRRDFWRPHRLY